MLRQWLARALRRAPPRRRDRQRLGPVARRRASARALLAGCCSRRWAEPGDARADELAAGRGRRRHAAPRASGAPGPRAPEDRLAARRRRRRRLRARRFRPALRRRRRSSTTRTRTRRGRRSRRSSSGRRATRRRWRRAAPEPPSGDGAALRTGCSGARAIASVPELTLCAARAEVPVVGPQVVAPLPPATSVSSTCSRGSTAASAPTWSDRRRRSVRFVKPPHARELGDRRRRTRRAGSGRSCGRR